MAVGILTGSQPATRFYRLADHPIDEASWPLGKPEGATKLGDLTEGDHLVLTVNSRSLVADRRGLRCRVSAMILEPPVIQARFYYLLPWIGSNFHRVLTHNGRLLKGLPNARFIPHGGQHVRQIPGVDTPKTELVSLIASKKRNAPGHRLRHRLAEWSKRAAPNLTLLGRAYRSISDKADGHAPFYYSVVIENSREPGYFTEKLTDSVLCMSLPIYWGAPDVEHFFDPRGMIVCRTERELRSAVLACNEKEYAARRPYLEENRRRALEYVDPHRHAAVVLEREDEFALDVA